MLGLSTASCRRGWSGDLPWQVMTRCDTLTLYNMMQLSLQLASLGSRVSLVPYILLPIDIQRGALTGHHRAGMQTRPMPWTLSGQTCRQYQAASPVRMHD